jgi:TetR/AcrR family transcriptional regulator, tetracycline repressor protein
VPRTGRPPTLSRERIVDAALELLEHGGADAITTRSLGDALGVHPTALYRHFRDMDELLRVAADKVLVDVVGQADALDGAPAGRDALTEVMELCRRLRDTLMSHPGAAQVMSGGPSRSPNERRFTERMLMLLSSAGLGDEECALAYHALVEFVVGSAAIDTRAAGTPEADIELEHDVWRAAYGEAAAAEFPTTARLATWLYPSQEAQFAYGLDLLIASLGARLDADQS